LVAEAPSFRGRRLAGHLEADDLAFGTPDGWDEVVVDPHLIGRLATDRPDLLRRARKVWVGTFGSGGPSPFVAPLPRLGRGIKRALDVILALVGLVLALPLLAICMVAVRCESAGPVIFRQVRMGANGRRFWMYKLRTMYRGNDDAAHQRYVAQLIAGTAERCGDIFKLADDPRITRVGRFLRHFSLDELPQLWNVLRGDMSLVGPRPPLPGETELYSAEAWQRLRVRPGITGLWQVSGRCQLTFDEMVALDIRYWTGWKLRSDVVILLKTPRAVFAGRGAA
jgi:lipopolysaccharide/colanic/teichoic acid biosynthesis glycosyltransferase